MSSRLDRSTPPFALVTAMIWAAACSGAERSRPAPRPVKDPSVQVLDGILARVESTEQRRPRGETVADCLARTREELGQGCKLPPSGKRTYQVRVALDPLYQRRWPHWEERFMGTMECVNRVYKASGTTFVLESVVEWSPGAERHDLRRLLDRLRKEVQASEEVLRLGVVVWSKRRVMSQIGGEIGLSQAGACVVPAWPQPENDCITTVHELGHLVGARHVPGEKWLMAWKGRTYKLPVSDPMSRVVANHRFHPRNREGIRVHHAARQSPHGLYLSQGCEIYMAGVDRCWALTGLR